MLTIETAQATSFPISWAGVSDLDGSRRFEVIGAEMPILFSIFTDREHTKTLTRVFDEDRRTFEGSASFSSVLTGSLAINWHYLGLETITIGGVNRKVVTWT